MSNESPKIPCRCCGTFHDPTLCSQCVVAGCSTTVGKKNHKCRLQGSLTLPLAVALFFALLLIPALAAGQTSGADYSCDHTLWKHV